MDLQDVGYLSSCDRVIGYGRVSVATSFDALLVLLGCLSG